VFILEGGGIKTGEKDEVIGGSDGDDFDDNEVDDSDEIDDDECGNDDGVVGDVLMIRW